jgi:Ca2+-dependent lipid-binding protein
VVQSYHGKQKTIHKTTVVKKNLNPLWTKESFTCKIPPTKLKFIVKDHNLFGENKDLGEFDLDIMEQLLPGVVISSGTLVNIKFDRWFPITLGGTGEVHITGEIKVKGK